MFANLYIYFICLKLFVKKNTNKFKQVIGLQSILLYVTKGPERNQVEESQSPNIHSIKNQQVAPFFLEHTPNYSKKYYFIHFKEVFPEKIYFTEKLPNNAPKLFAKTSSISGSLSFVATP